MQIWLGPSGTCSVPKSGKHPLLCRRRMHELPAAAGWRRSGSGALRVRPEIKKNFKARLAAHLHSLIPHWSAPLRRVPACDVHSCQTSVKSLLLPSSFFPLFFFFSLLLLLSLSSTSPGLQIPKLSSKMATQGAGNVNHVISKSLPLRPAAQSCSSPTRPRRRKRRVREEGRRQGRGSGGNKLCEGGGK